MEMWKICTLHFAFCINLNDLNFVVSYFTYFPFCIFFSLVQQIFEKENCCMELNSVCLPQSRWDDMHNICVRNSLASKLEIPLMFADVCSFALCSVHCAQCSVSDVCTVHLQCAATPLARCHKDTKGTTSTQPKIQKKPHQSQHVCNMHCSACGPIS